MKQKSKHILITGVSTGIGYGTAKELIRRNYTVLGSVRKQEDAQRLQSEFGDRFIPLLFDVTDQEAIDKAVEEVKKHLNGEGLGGLINNSGISVAGPVEHLDINRVINNFNVNVFGIFRVTKAFLPLLGTAPDHPTLPGRILNISSVAGKMCAPYLSPYTGTKHAVEGISHCLRRELLPYGIDVIIIGPGPIQTPIWDKGSLDEYKNTRYIASLYKFFTQFISSGKEGMPLEECARQIADAFEKDKPKTRYAIVKDKFKTWTLPQWMPDRTVDSFFLKNMM